MNCEGVIYLIKRRITKIKVERRKMLAKEQHAVCTVFLICPFLITKKAIKTGILCDIF